MAIAASAVADEQSLPRRTIDDAINIATAPVARWRGHEWARFGEGVGLVLAVHQFDKRLLDALNRNHHKLTDRYLRAVTHLGGGVGDDVAFAMIAGGYVVHDRRLMNTGIDAFESSTFASAVTKAGKKLARRERPNGSDNQSFPSGHATSSFALPTAIAARYGDKPFVAPIAYTLATSVAVARVNDRVHFPSDVVAGALIGRAMAKSVVGRHVAITAVKRALLVHVAF